VTKTDVDLFSVGFGIIINGSSQGSSLKYFDKRRRGGEGRLCIWMEKLSIFQNFL